MTELSKRLQMIASLIRPGSWVADVGTDHGYLPIYLVERGIAVRAIAMDIRKGPLARAEEHICQAGLKGRIETRLGNGLEQLNPGEADTVIIAGMGGPLILEILDRGKEVIPSVSRFVLSPQSDWRGFRVGLREQGFTILEERMVCEEGKFYLIVEAAAEEKQIIAGSGRNAEKKEIAAGSGRIAEKKEIAAGSGRNAEEKEIAAGAGRIAEEKEIAAGTELEDRFGRCLLEKGDPVLLDYLNWQRRILAGILDRLPENGTAGVCRRREQVEEDMAAVKAALRIIEEREKTEI